MTKKILLVEDDFSLGQTLSERLKKDFDVHWTKAVNETLLLFSKNQDFDLVILDIGLPDGDGFELAKKILAKKNILFIFLTAQADAESRLRGFELGAQEYIPKPFHLKELLMRVHHVLDTHQPQLEITVDDLLIDLVSMSVKDLKTGKIEFPPMTDMKVLKLLIEKSPRILSRDEMIDAVWGEDKMSSHRTVDNVIVRLRQLLGGTGDGAIRSVRGIGYQWLVENEKGTL